MFLFWVWMVLGKNNFGVECRIIRSFLGRLIVARGGRVESNVEEIICVKDGGFEN